MILFNAGKGFLCKYMIKYDMQIIFYKFFKPVRILSRYQLCIDSHRLILLELTFIKSII